MKKTTTKKLSERLLKYGALSAAIAGVTDATGQIQYTDVDPDETISGTRFMLDLNGDSIDDYIISNDGAFSGVEPATTARVYTENSSSILGIATAQYNYPFALDEGATIDASATDWVTAPYYQTLNWQGCAYTNSQWCGVVDKYLGLRITVDGEQHYGWARLDVPLDASSITIKDYAFNTVPGEGIDAGEVDSANTLDYLFSDFSYFIEKGQLSLNASTPMELVKLHNILGQHMLTEKLNSTSEVIDISSFESGVYLATITIDNQSKSFKIVKK